MSAKEQAESDRARAMAAAAVRRAGMWDEVGRRDGRGVPAISLRPAHVPPPFLPPRMQAEARKKKFDQSAVGKATKKAVTDAKKPAADARGDAVARDWLS